MKLSHIDSVDIRTIWANEEYDFTPWLAKESNLQTLADELGIDLELENIEVPIGSYKADIVARDGDGRLVIIENQLSKTDHKHLGQLITYASGLDARIVIWVCIEVTDEHRQAVDWLNEMTTSEVAFFACQIEVLQIDESLPAPRFRIISSPNDWSKSVKSAVPSSSLSDTRRMHLEFWNGFKQFMEEAGTDLRLRTPRPQHWYAIAVGRSKFNMSLTTNTQAKRVGCEIYIRGKTAKKAFSLLKDQKGAIEAELGNELEWQELPEGQDCRIIQYRGGNTKNPSEWQQLYSWLKERSEAFHKAFSSRIKQLPLTDI